jgi:seryl-tRNA synthetase
MRFILLIFLFGCQAIGQKENDNIKEDAEFKSLLNKVEANTQASNEVQKKASESQTKIVKETITKIVTLKEENKDLKIQLNEVKGKLDSVSADMGIPIKLLPISPKKSF